MRDWETFEVTFRHSAGTRLDGGAGGQDGAIAAQGAAARAGVPLDVDVRITCIAAPGTPKPQPPTLPALPYPPPPPGLAEIETPEQALSVVNSPYAVTVTLEVAGDVESFDDTSKRAIGARLAAAAKVDPKQVTISVRPASVNVDVRRIGRCSNPRTYLGLAAPSTAADWSLRSPLAALAAPCARRSLRSPI